MLDLPPGDIVAVLAVGLGASLLVGLPGAVALRMARRRTITVHVTVLLTITVLAVLAGVVGAAQAMFLSAHDRDVVLLVLAGSGAVSLAVGWWLAARLARDAVWADQLRQRERQAEANRRELVAWVSHDLRTPLAGLRAMAEALEDGVVADPVTTADYHRRIRVEADRMAQLVDDLFELSRINAGALRLSLRRIPLAEVVSDALASAEPLARARRIRLVAAEHGWPAVVASEPELARVVGNLLRNAVRFTPYDGVVWVSAGRDGNRAWFAVSDTCGGIPDADLPRVFDVAFRGEPARSPATTVPGPAGGGLGLAIVRGLVEAHGGRVEVANSGPGCRFLVHLPAAAG
ncbi:HAMP domain-containing sensor histidine kinase [Solwaraspora sp. WMMD406]|uniref:sensor histidine kinase n=1 Tax=Solwaraspora sp. WMMD406 TaxID=3016095 RepID=UPI002416D087|nr:HAMP domain-containing sensor histidine kinase [Solwaraspora sp. WMMD406]MDG4764110.1 HAMP domain-containing sensor histidine kinase [Solwaraspora sp. WMMD406]